MKLPTVTIVETDPATMANAEITREQKTLERASHRLCDLFIAEGRGYETASETRRKSDPLAQLSNRIWDRQAALRSEIRARYGSQAPHYLPRGGARIREG